MKNPYDLGDRVAVITGGNSGIGLESARAFASQGAHVILFARDEEKLARALAGLEGSGSAVRGDAANLEDLDRLAEHVRERHGRCDVLFVNAGMGEPRPFEQVDEAHWDRHFGVNLKGAFFAVQKLAPLLGEGASVILNTSCLARLGMPGMAVYAATKAGLRSLARSLSRELAPRGVRVNAVAPGPIETPIYQKMGLPPEAVEEMGRQIVEQVPAGRFGRPEEVAQLVLWLASSASDYVRGAEFTIDGGMSQL